MTVAGVTANLGVREFNIYLHYMGWFKWGKEKRGGGGDMGRGPSPEQIQFQSERNKRVCEAIAQAVQIAIAPPESQIPQELRQNPYSWLERQGITADEVRAGIASNRLLDEQIGNQLGWRLQHFTENINTAGREVIPLKQPTRPAERPPARPPETAAGIPPAGRRLERDDAASEEEKTEVLDVGAHFAHAIILAYHGMTADDATKLNLSDVDRFRMTIAAMKRRQTDAGGNPDDIVTGLRVLTANPRSLQQKGLAAPPQLQEWAQAVLINPNVVGKKNNVPLVCLVSKNCYTNYILILKLIYV